MQLSAAVDLSSSDDGISRTQPRATAASPSSAAACPTGPASTSSATTRGKVIYVGKAKSIRKRVAGHFSNVKGAGATRGAIEMVDRIHQIDFLLVASEAEALLTENHVHQAVQAALQRPPARRQVLSVPGDLARRGLPARLLHARAPPPRPRRTSARTRTPRRCAARSTCCRRSSRFAPAAAPSPAGAAARRAWTSTSSAAARRASATSPRRSTARRSTASSTSCRAATARSSATSSGA